MIVKHVITRRSAEAIQQSNVWILGGRSPGADEVVLTHGLDALPKIAIIHNALHEASIEFWFMSELDKLLGVEALLGQHIQYNFSVRPKNRQLLQYDIDLRMYSINAEK